MRFQQSWTLSFQNFLGDMLQDPLEGQKEIFLIAAWFQNFFRIDSPPKQKILDRTLHTSPSPREPRKHTKQCFVVGCEGLARLAGWISSTFFFFFFSVNFLPLTFPIPVLALFLAYPTASTCAIPTLLENVICSLWNICGLKKKFLATPPALPVTISFLRQWVARDYTYLQNKRMRRCGVAPPSIIFERLKLPQQIIYRRKENLSESPNHQKYWENILVSRFYEQFSRNRRNLGHFRKFEKISNS